MDTVSKQWLVSLNVDWCMVNIIVVIFCILYYCDAMFLDVFGRTNVVYFVEAYNDVFVCEYIMGRRFW